MLEKRIYNDYLKALKAKDRHKIDFLSFVRSELKNCAISLKKEKLEDNEVLSVLKKQQKRLQDAKESIPLTVNSVKDKTPRASNDYFGQPISNGTKGNFFQDLDDELNILSGYLPKPLKDNELLRLIEEVISETNASSIKDMGKVMKEILLRAGVRADSKKVSTLVKSKLSVKPPG